MSQEDHYFRFPLAALTYGPPEVTLHHIISWAVLNAGKGARATMDKEDFEALAYRSIDELGWDYEEGSSREATIFELAVGASLCDVTAQVWEGLYQRSKSMDHHVTAWCKASGDARALVTMKAEWVWQALDTALMEAGQPPMSGRDKSAYRPISWEEFTILSAILSVIGSKPFAYISSSDILHRACGYTRARSFRASAAPATEHLPVLKRWKIDQKLHDLELNRFFVRHRASLGKTGGRTVYSIRHATRQSLVEAVRERRRRRMSDTVLANRELDRQLHAPSAPATAPSVAIA